MTLSRSQKALAARVSPERLAEIEAECRTWIVTGKCGWTSTVWETGGIRYKARGTRWTWGKCPGCGKRHTFRISRG